MLEAILLQVVKEVVVPELAQFIKHKFETTGEWPTKEELELRVATLADAIINNGNEFLARKVDNATPSS